MSNGGSYDPHTVEGPIYQRWEQGGYFNANPNPAKQPYVIDIPLPNVTGALHLGHALNNTLQDTLIRYHRMRGFEALWMPGTDHAGIATQAVVERKLKEEQNLTRHQLGREGLVKKIWQWKEEYGGRILEQLRRLGASCDWRRARFTLDEICARAVYEVFFEWFKAGLIYRGLRLVNWDAFLQTAVADDEIVHETVKGHFWHLRYPVLTRDESAGLAPPKLRDVPGTVAQAAIARATAEGAAAGTDFLSVATTRPETMLGDTAVCVHPDDERYRALIGHYVLLPLQNRAIPIIADGMLAKMELGTGCVKVTPGHDPNDYACGLRNGLEMISILTPDGKINASGGAYAGEDRYAARKKVVADLEALGLMEKVEDYEHEVGHSDRSKTPIEPLLSEQWFVKMADLAEMAMEAARDGRVTFFPQRYEKTFLDWLGEKRDWCISRQLWWGHRIPVWRRRVHLTAENSWNTLVCDAEVDHAALGEVQGVTARIIRCATGADWTHHLKRKSIERASDGNLVYTISMGAFQADWLDEDFDVLVCPREPADGEHWEKRGFEQDPDVLDTWFSSALWPFSTLGWPDSYGGGSLKPTGLPGADKPLPVWQKRMSRRQWSDWIVRDSTAAGLIGDPADVWQVEVVARDGKTYRIGGGKDSYEVAAGLRDAVGADEELVWRVSLRDPDAWLGVTPKSGEANWIPPRVEPRYAAKWLEENGFKRESPKLDAELGSGRRPTSPSAPTDLSYFYPTTVLVTNRDIITLWVARMVMTGLYFQGRVPFSHVHIHPTVQDGQGRRMSKSLGNGVDPLDIITLYGTDALRYTMVQMDTETQDARLPVDYLCPHCQAEFGQKPKHLGKPRVACEACGKEFATRVADAETVEKLGLGLTTSPKFELGRNFANKIWQASTGFVIPNLGGGDGDSGKSGGAGSARSLADADLAIEDSWILSRLAAAIGDIDRRFASYQLGDVAGVLYGFFWNDFCDWYVELVKPRLFERGDDGQVRPKADASAGVARQVLAHVLDQALRLMHPIMPFVTEAVWERLNAAAPRRGVDEITAAEPLLIAARWPAAGPRDIQVEREMGALQDIIRALRDTLARINTSRSQGKQPAIGKLPQAVIRADASVAAGLAAQTTVLERLGRCEHVEVGTQVTKPAESATQVLTGVEVYVPLAGLMDLAAERTRLGKERDQLQGHLERLAAKLGNEGFIAKAPAAVVEQERQRMAEMKDRLATLERNLAEITG